MSIQDNGTKFFWKRLELETINLESNLDRRLLSYAFFGSVKLTKGILAPSSWDIPTQSHCTMPPSQEQSLRSELLTALCFCQIQEAGYFLQPNVSSALGNHGFGKCRFQLGSQLNHLFRETVFSFLTKSEECLPAVAEVVSLSQRAIASSSELSSMTCLLRWPQMIPRWVKSLVSHCHPFCNNSVACFAYTRPC